MVFYSIVLNSTTSFNHVISKIKQGNLVSTLFSRPIHTLNKCPGEFLILIFCNIFIGSESLGYNVMIINYVVWR